MAWWKKEKYTTLKPPMMRDRIHKTLERAAWEAFAALSNTLVAPFTLVAPLLGGLLADGLGYRAMFSVASAGGIATLAVLVLLVREPTVPAPVRAVESQRAT
mgnify:CR=1 FL=1